MRKIKKGDSVKILTGKDRGKTGEVIKVLTNSDRVVVEGINIITKHKKQTMNEPAAKVKMPGPIHISNVMLLDPETGKPTRVGFEINKKTGKKYRVSVKTGNKIDK